MSQDLKLAGSSANYHPRNNFLYIGKWKGGGQGGFTHMRAIKFNFFKLFSPCILLHCAGQESWKVDRNSLIHCRSCAVGFVMLCGVVHTEQALGGEGKYRGLDLILITKLITDTSNPYWENSHQYWGNLFCRQHRTVHEMCLGNTKTKMGRNPIWKMQSCELPNWGWRTSKLGVELNLL